MAKICFVTYNYGDLETCEGAGRWIYNLSCLLDKNGHIITILIAGGDWDKEKSYMVECLGKNIKVMHLSEKKCNEAIFPKENSLITSYKVYKWLESSDFEFIFFLDSGASGFHTVQAKRVIGQFSNCSIIVNFYGTNRWFREKTQQWSDGSLSSLRLNYMEKYCCEHADIFVSPSIELLNWCSANKFNFDGRKEIIPYLSENEDINIDNQKYNVESKWVNLFSKKQVPVYREKSIYPKVSVCMAYYNHGQYLTAAVESLATNTYPNFEVIIVNDGSTDPDSIQVFENLKNKYRKNNFIFISKENEYLGKTRNIAASYANGEYLVFMDSDNIAHPDMIEWMVSAMELSAMDCLTCHNEVFVGKGMPNSMSTNKEVFSPVGPAVDVGIFENCYGDANFIIKKSVFDKIGGFTTERLSYEDWQFLVKIALKGYKQDVIPKVLYMYRVTNDSMVHTANMYKSHIRILDTYNEALPIHLRGLFTEYIFPTWYNSFANSTTLPMESDGMSTKLIKKVNKILPLGTRRRVLFKKVCKLLLR